MQELLRMTYAALIIAGGGAFLRFVFFKNWISIMTVFLVLFLVWWVVFFVLLWVIRISIPHLYVWIFKGGDLSTVLPSEDATSSGFSKTTMSKTDEVSTEDIFKTGGDTDATKSPDPEADDDGEKDSNLDGEDFPQRVKPPKKRVSTELSDEEIARIKNFEPKDIAKAVSFMMGPDEDNPLLKNKPKPRTTRSKEASDE